MGQYSIVAASPLVTYHTLVGFFSGHCIAPSRNLGHDCHWLSSCHKRDIGSASIVSRNAGCRDASGASTCSAEQPTSGLADSGAKHDEDCVG
jgi:hypothetical protein